MIRTNIHIFLSVCILAVCSHTHAQTKSNFTLSIQITEVSSDYQIPNYKTNHRDSISASNEIISFVKKAQKRGFTAASADSVIKKRDTLIAYIYIGEDLSEYAFNLSSQSKINFANLGISVKGNSISPQTYNKLKKKFIENAENQGFPFAKIWVTDSINQLWINTDTGSQVIIDQIYIIGYSGIRENFVLKQAEVERGMPYSENKIKSIAPKLNRSGFLATSQQPEVRFYKNGKADITLIIKKQKASQLDALIGFSSPQKRTKVNTLSFTGHADLLLANAFKHGEEIYLNWSKPSELSQSLKSSLLYKYIFNTKLGASGSFSLHKQDTSYIKRGASVGIPLFWNGGNYIKPFFATENAFTLTSTQESADIYNYTTNSFGLECKLWQTDNDFNPSRGYVLDLSINAGQKEIFAQSDSTTYKSHFQATLSPKLYFPLISPLVFHIGAEAGHLQSESISASELYLLGGTKILRGFREQEIPASSYLISTTELRLLFQKNSHLFLFSDWGRYWKKSKSSFSGAPAFSLGAGMRLRSRSSIFSISYATGKIGNSQLQIKNAVVHFGYSSIF